MAVSSTTGSAASTSASAVACSCCPFASSDSTTAAHDTLGRFHRGHLLRDLLDWTSTRRQQRNCSQQQA
ncbi:hypothetical protein PF008_g8983 [Phytophthora fragariae]|uniref:Uncharacterized protein n=1 Tax=Phytophthora fragariae TaxID=53985 RepID=A0A6G0RXZ7_9STRA|nr:hypothetical protein PF008_g8983 [Phytophthora fragariae]